MPHPKTGHSGSLMFPISRDPPEGGTSFHPVKGEELTMEFPISRDPPEGGTLMVKNTSTSMVTVSNF